MRSTHTCIRPLRLLPLVLVLVPVTGTAVVWFTGAASAAPKAVATYLELATSTGVGKVALPADGSRWLEIHPNLDVAHIQTAIADDGDGELSVGDTIDLDGSEFRINWVGPTFHLNCGTNPDRAFQPTVLPATGDPTGQLWSQVQPSFGALQPVDSWTDNGDLTLGPFDRISISGENCGVLAALLTIVVEPGAVPNGQSAWGTLKAAY